MAHSHTTVLRALFLGTALIALSACDDFDLDLRNNFGNAPDTSSAARTATAPRPSADNRGVISYPNYQVAVANRGDTVTDVANRVGISSGELARFNGVEADTPLRKGEVLALPKRVQEPSPATGSTTTGPLQPETIDITTLAGSAIERADQPAASTPAANRPTGVEPVRHKVERGETAYSIARLYNVSVRSMSEWNGLGANLSVREGQYLLIPVATANQPVRTADASGPGQGSATPIPPSSTSALPNEAPVTATAPSSPNLGGQQTTASSSSAKLLTPVQGNIIRPYSSKSDGIDIAAAAGTPVRAAESGTVAAITRDTDQVPILVIRHPNNLLTIYANIDAIAVKKGDTVKRGDTIAKVRAGSPSFVHFEIRKNFDSVDPAPYLN